MNTDQLDLLVERLWNAESKEEVRKLLDAQPMSNAERIRRCQEMQELWMWMPVPVGKEKIYFKNILYIKAERQYSDFYLQDQVQAKITVSHNLHFYEVSLKDYGFQRIHREFVVNLFRIQQVSPNYTDVLFPNGVSLYVTPAHRSELEERLMCG